MANITATMVKDLRDKTGAGMMDCKNALTETAGDMEAAIDWLRKKGISKAAKRSLKLFACARQHETLFLGQAFRALAQKLVDRAQARD